MGKGLGNVLSAREAAKRLGVHDTTVIRWVKAGVLPATYEPKKPGSGMWVYRIAEEEVENILAGSWNGEGMKV